MSTDFYIDKYSEDFKKFKYKKSPVILQKVFNKDKKIICHRVQYAGNDYYFLTEPEVFAYCTGRKFIKPESNPYNLKDENINGMCLVSTVNEISEFNNRVKIQSRCDVENERFYYCAVYRNKTYCFESEAEIYAFCIGRFAWVDFSDDPYHISSPNFKYKDI